MGRLCARYSNMMIPIIWYRLTTYWQKVILCPGHKSVYFLKCLRLIVFHQMSRLSQLLSVILHTRIPAFCNLTAASHAWKILTLTFQNDTALHKLKFCTQNFYISLYKNAVTPIKYKAETPKLDQVACMCIASIAGHC